LAAACSSRAIRSSRWRPPGQTETIAGEIADQGGSGGSGAGRIVIAGSGTVDLDPTAANGSAENNTYSGGTTIQSGTLELAHVGAAGSGDIIFSAGSTGILQFGAAATPTNAISGFAVGQGTLDIQGIGTATSAVLSANDVLTIGGGTVGGVAFAPVTVQLDPSQSYAGDIFTLASDGAANGTLVTVTQSSTFVVRNEADLNTAIRDINSGTSPAGTAYTIDFDLAPGSHTLTLMSALEAINLGSGSLTIDGADILPTCIKAGALADNVPARDLWVSPNHAMFLSGVLIEAKDLVNGISIVQAETVESVEYFHIELDTHDVIIAEGALSETFIDDDSRAMFHNAHDYETLYQEERPAPAHYCAPRLNEGYGVEGVRQRLALRAGLLRSADPPQLGALRGYIDRIRASSIAGWAQNTDAPEAPVCLDIYADGKFLGRVLANTYREDLKTAGLGSGHHGFAFTPCAGLVFAPDTIEVRRSLDGARLDEASAAPQMRKVAAA
jgi:hypothetical protein